MTVEQQLSSIQAGVERLGYLLTARYSGDIEKHPETILIRKILAENYMSPKNISDVRALLGWTEYRLRQIHRNRDISQYPQSR